MIPPDLLIQVAPIHWIGGFSIYALLSGILITGGLSLFYHLAKDQLDKSIDRSKKASLLATIPHIESATFERESALLLRSSLRFLYLPKQSQAHTLQDIRQYVDDAHILGSLEKLEISEYRNIPLNHTDRKEIIATLIELREKIKNPTK